MKLLTSMFPTGVMLVRWRSGPIPTDRARHGTATAERVLQLPRRGQGHQRTRQVQGLRSEEGGDKAPSVTRARRVLRICAVGSAIEFCNAGVVRVLHCSRYL